MAGEAAAPIKAQQGLDYGGDLQTFVFGPFNQGGTFATTDLIICPPFPYDFIIDKIQLFCTTKATSSGSGGLFTGKPGDGSVANAISSGRDIIAAWATTGLTNFQSSDATISVDNNLLEAGNWIVADFQADPALAGFFIRITGRMKRPAVAPGL